MVLGYSCTTSWCWIMREEVRMKEIILANGFNFFLKFAKKNIMETYKCSKCGMSVNATCGKCDAPLVNDVLKLDDGREVQISKCPNGHGKIKSPLCCGEDMSCAI